MAQPPTNPMIASTVTRGIPAIVAQAFPPAPLANNGTFQVEFDLWSGYVDPNKIFNGFPPPGVENPQSAAGPFVDIYVSATQVGTVKIETASARGGTYQTLETIACPAGAATITSRRISGPQFLRLTYTNTSGGVSTVEVSFVVRTN